MDKDTRLIFEAYQLSGKAKNQTLEDLAKKHKIDVEKLKAQLNKGIKTEHEHTKDDTTARKIAMDHLAEDPEYYDKLAKIEKSDEDAEMPYPEFARLSKHTSPRSSKEKDAEEFKEQLPDSREEYEDRDEDEERASDIKRRKDNESRWMSVLKSHFGKEYKREGVDPYIEFFERYSPYHEDWVIRKFSDMYNETWASDPESRIDVEHFIKLKNELRNKKDIENEKLQSGSEEEERRLDPKCWKGYHKVGTKLKDGVRVNNCVKNK